MPAFVALGAGLFAVFEHYCMCIATDEGESFAMNLDAALPDWLFNHDSEEALHNHPFAHCALAYTTFVVGTIVFLSWTGAVVCGLLPDLEFLLGSEDAHPPTLAQAELWGSCGFIFAGFHMSRGISFVFSTWDDLEALKTLMREGSPDLQPNEMADVEYVPVSTIP